MAVSFLEDQRFSLVFVMNEFEKNHFSNAPVRSWSMLTSCPFPGYFSRLRSPEAVAVTRSQVDVSPKAVDNPIWGPACWILL